MRNVRQLALLVFSQIVGLSLSLSAGEVIKFHNKTVVAEPISIFQALALNNFSNDYVIQFKKPITEKDKSELKAMGIQIFRYIPDDALVVRATGLQLEKYSHTQKLVGALAYDETVRVSESIEPTNVFSKIQRKDISISSFTDEDAKSLYEYIQNLEDSVRVYDHSKNIISLNVRADLIEELAQFPGVEFVQPLFKMETFGFNISESEELDSSSSSRLTGNYTDLSGFESGTKILNAEMAWSAGYMGEGQTIGIADTGFDTGVVSSMSGDFTGATKAGLAFGVGAKDDWSDPMGHGTHVAGSVLGRGGPSSGLIKGVAYKSTAVFEGMWSPVIGNLTVPPKLKDLFEAAYKNGARIHTNSWGSANPKLAGTYEGTAQQVDQYMWENPDMLVLFAAGNSGVDKDKNGKIDPGSVGPPGTAKNILTVGASENLVFDGGIQAQIKDLKTGSVNWGAEPIFSSKVSDNVNGMAMFSSRGPTKDGRVKPEIVAPGTNILSSRSHVDGAEVLWGEYNKDYVFSGGTSMSTPLVAGSAAVAREVLIKKYRIANPSSSLLKAALLHSSKDMFPGQYGTTAATQELSVRPNSDEGYGRLDLGLMVNQLKTQYYESEVAQGAEVKFPVTVQKGNLLVNLVYLDAPASPAAAATLVNDLDLEIQNAKGEVLKKSAPDRINNHEFFEQSGLPAGQYSIVVKGFKIPVSKNGKLPFALAVTGE